MAHAQASGGIDSRGAYAPGAALPPALHPDRHLYRAPKRGDPIATLAPSELGDADYQFRYPRAQAHQEKTRHHSNSTAALAAPTPCTATGHRAGLCPTHQARTDPWQAAGFLAISIDTLLRVYGHHHPDYQREAV